MRPSNQGVIPTLIASTYIDLPTHLHIEADGSDMTFG